MAIVTREGKLVKVIVPTALKLGVSVLQYAAHTGRCWSQQWAWCLPWSFLRPRHRLARRLAIASWLGQRRVLAQQS